jgi:uncharacterized protein YfaS (alpha-2-macroglobulin family)
LRKFVSEKANADERFVPDHEKNLEPHVRQWFPETLLWQPELITDEQGRAHLEIPLADNITTWRLTASAVTADGKLGASQTPIKVFQPFFVEINVPIALTLEDEIALPVVVYNYLDKAQEVKLDVAAAPWYESEEPALRRLDLQPGEVRSVKFRLRAKKVGTHELQITATGSGVADAVKRRIEVRPGGRRIETVWNGSLHQAAEFPLTLPAEAIPGSGRLFVKIYPSQFSQVVEGLDAIFRLPYGCFEQTSSTTYPNVLALDYLQRTKKTSRAVEDKAKKYITLGYQRLVSFEVAGGGFDWFGRPPANQVLTAYGLMEFADMAKVHDVDPRLIERTRAWLLQKRNADGSWTPDGHALDEAARPGRFGGGKSHLGPTAYIAWAVFRGAGSSIDAGTTRQFLLRHRPQNLDDPHLRYHVPSGKPDAKGSLALSVDYDRKKVSVGENVKVQAAVANRTQDAAPMVMVELPIPAGFAVVPEAFAKLKQDGRIAKYEVQPLAVLVYLRELPAGKSLQWAYDLRAVMPAQVAIPASRVYEYYNPDREGHSESARLTVVEAN